MSIFYLSKRVGQFGQKFTLYKFRTMKHGSEKYGPSTAGDDSRLTKIGGFLRKYKIDELPQIINLIKGDINLVGCRPDVPKEIRSLDKSTRYIVLSKKPGLFSPATLWNFHEEDQLAGQKDPHRFYCQKIKPIKYKLNVWYCKNKSWRLDLRIFIQSLLRLVGINVDCGAVPKNLI